MAVKTPKYTDAHKYPHGYKRAVDTDITATIRREQKRIEQNQQEAQQKVSTIKQKRRQQA